MSQPNLRRSFRNDRMRALYDRACEAEWSAEKDGAGHVRMVSPDGNTVMVMSTTAVDTGRSVLNTEAVFKRWLRGQRKEERVNQKIEAAITDMQGRDAAKQLLGVDLERPLPPNEEDTVKEEDTTPTNGKPEQPSPETALSAPDDGRFSIEDIETIAEYAGDGGLVEVRKLVEGLRLINHMRTKR